MLLRNNETLVRATISGTKEGTPLRSLAIHLGYRFFSADHKRRGDEQKPISPIRFMAYTLRLRLRIAYAAFGGGIYDLLRVFFKEEPFFNKLLCCLFYLFHISVMVRVAFLKGRTGIA